MSAISRCGSAAVTRQNNVRRSWPIHPPKEQIAGFRTGMGPHDTPWPLTVTGKRVDVRADCGNGARPGSELVLTSRTQPPFVFYCRSWTANTSVAGA